LAEAELGKDQIKAKESEVNALAAQVNQAEAALTEAQSILNDLIIQAPATGMVTTRIVDNGEMVAAGSPLFDIVDLDKLYLKVYVPEKEIGKVRLGLPAKFIPMPFRINPFQPLFVILHLEQSSPLKKCRHRMNGSNWLCRQTLS